jgi:hypothetical protein
VTQNAAIVLALIGIGFGILHVGYELSRIADVLEAQAVVDPTHSKD